MSRLWYSTIEKFDVKAEFNHQPIEETFRTEMVDTNQDRAKRVFDFVIALLLIVFLTPALLLIAVAIKLTSEGPIFFKQKRHGRFKREFKILKFRSMMNAPDDGHFKQTQRNDPRVTPLGAFLRRTSLDELPQLWNVVVGEMSLVGPRPHAVSMDDDYAQQIPTYNQRFLLRPGITGLAQCQGFRGGINHMNQMIGRLCRDIYYVRNRSILLDVNILALTVINLFKHDAY